MEVCVPNSCYTSNCGIDWIRCLEGLTRLSFGILGISAWLIKIIYLSFWSRNKASCQFPVTQAIVVSIFFCLEKNYENLGILAWHKEEKISNFLLNNQLWYWFFRCFEGIKSTVFWYLFQILTQQSYENVRISTRHIKKDFNLQFRGRIKSMCDNFPLHKQYLIRCLKGIKSTVLWYLFQILSQQSYENGRISTRHIKKGFQFAILE